MRSSLVRIGRRPGAAIGLALALTACGDDGPVSPNAGSVEVTTVTEGGGLDQDGYVVEVEGGGSLAIGINATATPAEVPPGAVELRLRNVRGNCTIQDPNPRLIQIVAGEVSRTRFEVACVDTPLLGRIVFESDREGNFELYTMNPDGSDPRRLTDTPDDAEYYASISPNGSGILYSHRHGPDVLLSEINLMNAGGTEVVNLTNGAGFDDDPSWSPDGSRVVFTRFRDDGGDFDIWVMNADGTGSMNLTNTPTSAERTPVWSPDGSRILFTAFGGSGDDTHLEIMNADGTGRRPLTGDPGYSAVGTWAPDGSRIAFLAFEDVGFRLYTMNVDGSARVGLTPEGTVTDQLASWSPTGDRLVFQSFAEGDGEVI